MKIAQLETFHLGRSLRAELWEREMRDLQRLLEEDVRRVLHGEPPRCPVADSAR